MGALNDIAVSLIELDVPMRQVEVVELSVTAKQHKSVALDDC